MGYATVRSHCIVPIQYTLARVMANGGKNSFSWGLFLQGVARPPMGPFLGHTWRWRGLRYRRVPTVLHQSKTPVPGSLANSAELFWKSTNTLWPSLPWCPFHWESMVLAWVALPSRPTVW